MGIIRVYFFMKQSLSGGLLLGDFTNLSETMRSLNKQNAEL